LDVRQGEAIAMNSSNSSNSTIAIVFAAIGLMLVVYAISVSEQARDIYGHRLSPAYDAPAHMQHGQR
jgi:hypothetical protein